MVQITLASLALILSAGNAEVLEQVVSDIPSDAVVTVDNMPSIGGEELHTLFQKIQFRNLNSASAAYDDVRFRIAETDYTKFSNYMTDVFTPKWANSDLGEDTVDGKNGAKIRANKDGAGTNITSTMTMKVDKGDGDAPGNFHESEHGCFPDLHIGYVAAALTNAHEGRAVILNENSVFEKMNGSFGTDFMKSLFFSNKSGVTAGAGSGGSGYRELDLEGDLAGPLKELWSALYHEAPERFQEATLNDTEEFQALPIKPKDNISISVTVTAGLSMGVDEIGGHGTAGAASIPVLKYVTNVAHAVGNTNETSRVADATFKYPIYHSTDGTANTNFDYTTSALSLATQIRSQVYEVKMIA